MIVYGESDFEFLLGGLEREFADGLVRLEAADAADNHVKLYRADFLIEVRELRWALSPFLMRSRQTVEDRGDNPALS